MASTDPLSSTARKHVAGQMNRFLPPPPKAPLSAGVAGGGGGGAPVQKLAEDFVVCTLSIQNVEHPPADLASLLAPTGRWLHTIRTGKTTSHVAFSRKQRLKAEQHEVFGVFEGRLTEKLAAAIKWFDKKDKSKTTIVRVLQFPAYYTTALGILQGDKVSAVLVDQPQSFTQLHLETVYPLDEFLAKLAQEPHT